MPAAEAGAFLTVDLGALADNWRLIRDRSGAVECAAVVKADAYGTGTEAAVPALAKAGCRTFFVAHLGEARRVRAIAQDATIYVLNGLLPGTEPVYRALALRPILGSAGEIADWAEFAAQTQDAPPAALHVDTGMNRLGLSVDEGLAMAGALPFAPALLMSHFTSSEEFGAAATTAQIAAFQRLREAYPGVPASLANSSGVFLDPAPGLDLARPGYALYGGNPTPEALNPMRPVVRLEATIIQTRDVPDGTLVGYNGRWIARGPRRLATLCIGYADGYPRTASAADAKIASGVEAGVALVGGVRCPFAGSVSMDLIILDVTDASAEAARRGARAVMIGDDLDIDEVGKRAGTVGYEILTSLGRRFARRYIGG
ncbi:MAG: alanine racemase [Salinarimonadaceae bacterium]|nr:MAG: alanine racemase [Salinarimonadaceae bacterium]